MEAANAAGGKDNVTVVIVEGERFTAPVLAVSPKPRRSRLWPIAAALFNLAFAAAVVYVLYKPKPPVIIEPRVLAAGAGAAYPTIAAAMAADPQRRYGRSCPRRISRARRFEKRRHAAQPSGARGAPHRFPAE